MNEITKVEPTEFGLDKKTSDSITKSLDVIIKERDLLQTAFDDVIELEITDENLPTFKSLRLDIVKNRTQGIVKWHTTNKQYFLRGGQFVDAIKNKEIAVNEGMESRLKKAETHFENIEKERIAKIEKEREIELAKYGVENPELYHLGSMNLDIWTNFLAGKKAGFEKAQQEEKEALEKQIADEKMEVLHNERLEKIIPLSYYKNTNDSPPNFRTATDDEFNYYYTTLVGRKRADDIERKKQADENERLRKQTENDAKEKELVKKKADEKLAKEKEIADAKIQKEKEAKEKAEKELAQIKADDDEKERLRLANIEAELKKGDAEKIKDLINDLNALKTKYKFESTSNKMKYQGVGSLIDKVTNYIKN